MLEKQLLSRIMVTAALTGGLILASAAVPARADRDWTDNCHKRLEAERARLDRDAARFGEHSPKADHDRARLEEARRWCRDHHAEWDHNVFDVGIYLK